MGNMSPHYIQTIWRLFAKLHKNWWFRFSVIVLLNDIDICRFIHRILKYEHVPNLNYISYLIFFQACMILSSLYHTFTCHSPKWSGTCLTLDLIGIIMAILATYLSGIYYAFWCEPYWRDFYLTTVGGFFIIGNQDTV